MCVVATITCTTEMDFSKAETIISAFLTSFLAAEVIISAAKKTASAAPAISVHLHHDSSNSRFSQLRPPARKSLPLNPPRWACGPLLT